MSSQIPETPPTAAHAKADVTRDLSTLMRQELELAKAEAKQSATRAGKGGGMLAGAGVAGHFVLLFLSVALWYTLGELMGLGWSAVVVAILASVGRKELKAIKGMPQTVETVQEIPPTLKPNGDHR